MGNKPSSRVSKQGKIALNISKFKNRLLEVGKKYKPDAEDEVLVRKFLMCNKVSEKVLSFWWSLLAKWESKTTSGASKGPLQNLDSTELSFFYRGRFYCRCLSLPQTVIRVTVKPMSVICAQYCGPSLFKLPNQWKGLHISLRMLRT